MQDRLPHDGTDYDDPAALRRAPPLRVSLAVTVALLALVYAVGNPVEAATALIVLAALVVTRGRLEA